MFCSNFSVLPDELAVSGFQELIFRNSAAFPPAVDRGKFAFFHSRGEVRLDSVGRPTHSTRNVNQNILPQENIPCAWPSSVLKFLYWSYTPLEGLVLFVRPPLKILLLLLTPLEIPILLDKFKNDQKKSIYEMKLIFMFYSWIEILKM